jgi:hypothetical protein
MRCAIFKEMFYTFKQGKNTSLQRYYELFLRQVEVLEEVGVTIPDESLIQTIHQRRTCFELTHIFICIRDYVL